jgi:cysteinyl-tRNA synthetase
MIGIDKFNLIKPTFLTKATDYIKEQIDLITILESKGYTYQISDGIYFDASKFKDYGKLADLNLKSLQAGARVEFNQEKRNIYDFALWKFTPKGQKRDMEWDSPWGKGFPGWHLECSAMALAKLGDTIDIHTGGIDHIPVHHTNEIAQSQSATGKKFANYWLHNNFLLVDGAKASKSLGNAYTLQDIESKGYSALDYKMFVLQSHYRKASNFTWENLDAAKNRLNNWCKIADLRWQIVEPRPNNKLLKYNIFKDRLVDVINNDMDTPGALVVVEEYLNRASTGFNKQDQLEFVKAIGLIQDLLGIIIVGPDITKQQKDLLSQRWQAKNHKDWAKADKIRIELSHQGLYIRDLSDYQIWERQ